MSAVTPPIGVRLRDGSVVSDARLDRLVQFDERSRNHPITRRLSSAEQQAPKTVMHYLDGKWYLNQGREGQCVSYAFGHELASRPSEMRGFTVDDLRRWYYRMQYTDVWPGGEYPGASPQYGGTSVLAGAALHKSLQHFRAYDWAFGEEQLRFGIKKGPAVIGVNWYEGMFDVGARGFISPTGSLAGGHAILVVGYNAHSDFYTLVNSWGRGWGKAGKCKITRIDLARLLSEDGECCIPQMRTTTPNLSPVSWSA